jgi:hypothetical protein
MMKKFILIFGAAHLFLNLEIFKKKIYNSLSVLFVSIYFNFNSFIESTQLISNMY